MMPLSSLRTQIRHNLHADEHQIVNQLLAVDHLTGEQRSALLGNARQLVRDCRADKQAKGTLDAFLLEFGLSNKEGVALMCLAEALLRVPDEDTADRLIAEKLQQGNWHSHRGKSGSAFVNASTWGLMLTGKIVRLDSEITEHTDHWLKRMTNRMGEPVIRRAVMQAMRIMGGQYVLGRSIEEGLKRGRKSNRADVTFSFDMLGEGARTEDDALRYLAAYQSAIDKVGQHRGDGAVQHVHGISVKLSAIHPRYHHSHREQVVAELLPRIKGLCLQAKSYDIGLSIDAEEAARLDLELDLFESLAFDPDLAGWQGLGFVMQAYLKTAPSVAQWLIELGRQSNRRLMVRLVKGAYWDAEIKHAQEMGLQTYPVFTRKPNTDFSYQHCAKLLLDASDAIYPQFATHNAYTAALILDMAGDRDFEFQRLHGMGHILYNQLQAKNPQRKIPLRVYAPIGSHKDLLPYLVRRLLENGANSSFVNRFLDSQTSVETLLSDNREQVSSVTPHRHSKIPQPVDILKPAGDARLFASGIDLDAPEATAALLKTMQEHASNLRGQPIIDGEEVGGNWQPLYNPAHLSTQIGEHCEVSDADIARALNSAASAYPQWNQRSANQRADILDRMAESMEARCVALMGTITAEAGRTVADALSEVREAVDFCRYYAAQARLQDQRQGRGVFLCISPWNFPLAIFCGQIAAALAAGNSVLAKPAEQTPAIATVAIKLFHQAGVPTDVLHLLPGDGARIGGQLLNDPRLQGVAFTGSTETAQIINRQLAARPGRPVPLIAETGGQNCMIVDSTALPEQVVDDVIGSAFQSAGQRCSALRVLFLQDDVADNILNMLKGAMQSQYLGDPALLASDIGPVIDAEAKAALNAHIERMNSEAKLVARIAVPESLSDGNFVAPHVFEIQSLAQLQKEVFGPVLHVIRFKASELKLVLQEINNTGFGLTMGIHSRIEAFAEYVFRKTKIGNTYINRNMVGAVVGVNPFGGCGLSGTGPKAGGPNYLLRYSQSMNDLAGEATGAIYDIPQSDANCFPLVANAMLAESVWNKLPLEQRLSQLRKVVETGGNRWPENYTEHLFKLAEGRLSLPLLLPGPTGEQNLLSLHQRGPVVVLASQHDSASTIHAQWLTALAAGCPVIAVGGGEKGEALIREAQQWLQECGLDNNLLQSCANEQAAALIGEDGITAVAANSASRNSQQLRELMAARQGAIIPLIEWPQDVQGCQYGYLFNYLVERTKTDNLVARGGNTQLFNLTE